MVRRVKDFLFMVRGLVLVSAVLWTPFSVAGMENKFGMAFVDIPAGEFIMGSRDLGAVANDITIDVAINVKDEVPAHKVVITKPFLMAATEVTQQQWLKVMGTKPGPSAEWQRKDWENLPVTGVSWNDSQRFILELNDMDEKYNYRLPTEAEWEYAARAGSSDLRPFPREELGKYAWYLTNSGDETSVVASKQPNAWGLYDIFGNVWEWVNDFYDGEYYKNSPIHDPQGPTTGQRKVRRGGSYHCQPHMVRSAFRAMTGLESRYSVIGFRLVAEPK